MERQEAPRPKADPSKELLATLSPVTRLAYAHRAEAERVRLKIASLEKKGEGATAEERRQLAKLRRHL